jgi:hypothetical protein
MYHGLTKSLRHIVEEAGVPKAAIMQEARGLRDGDATRPGDLVVLDYNAATILGGYICLSGMESTLYEYCNLLDA